MIRPTAGFRLHGLDVVSAVELHRPTVVGPPDVRITVGEQRPVPLDLPSGEVLAAVAVADGTPVHTAVQRPDGSRLLRLHRVCDLAVSADATELRMDLDPAIDEEALPVLANGTGFAFLLESLGHTVLHASAVQVGDVAIGFIGHRGRGKSTVAALACAAGAPLVTDDVLRVDVTDAGPRCWAGSSELRLRPRAVAVRDLFTVAPATRETFDGRTSISPPACTVDQLPLAALVLPVPDRDAVSVTVRSVPSTEAVMELSRAVRIEGWQRASDLARHFHAIVDLVHHVPVHVVTIPWGRFDAGGASELLDRVTAAIPGRERAMV